MATEVKKVYSLEIQGTDSVDSLRQSIEALNDKLKTLNETSKEYKDTLAQLTEYQTKLSDAMKGVSDSMEKADTSLSGIKNVVDSVTDSISNLGEDVLQSFSEGFAQGMADAATNTEKVSESTEKTISSVKDLKQGISDLRDRLVTLDKGSDDYKATVQELIDAQVKLKEVMNAGKNETQAAEGSYNALSQRMSALKQVWKEATDEATRNEIGKQIAEINDQLKGMDASVGNFQRNVGNYKSALDGLDGSFVNLKTQLRECKDALQQLDPSTEEYAQTMARAAEITHQLADQQEQIKYASTDFGDQLNNIRGIASNMAAGFGAVNAAMGLFGQENEDVQKAMLKVQQAMALVQGLQGLDGFIKRTKGLSQSMGLVTKATKANTVATQANAAASRSDATAKGAEAAATQGAVGPQLALNAAMKANPIGFIIGLIASLVAIFSLLKDKIMEMIGANEELSAVFEKVKAVLAGFGNVIKNNVINPIKACLIPAKTLAKVLVDLFSGNFKNIKKDLEDSLTEAKDLFINTINIVGNFKEGYDKKTAEQNEARRKKEAEAMAKVKDNYIKDCEAKYGADWKYTEKAKKEYEAYFRALAEMYDKNSDEYKQALRDKESYDRDYYNHQQEEIKKQEEWELKVNTARYGADYQYSSEWYDKQYKKWKQVEDQKSVYYAAGQQKLYEEAEVEWLNYLDGYKKHWEKKTKDMVESAKKTLNDFKGAFEKFLPEMLRTQWGFDDLKKIWENKSAMDSYKKYLKEVRKINEEDIDEYIKEIKNKWVTTTDDNLVKSLNSELEKSIYNADKKLSAVIEKTNLTFQGKEIFSGVTIPKDVEDHLTDVFKKTGEVLREEQSAITKQINEIFTELTKKGGNYVGYTKEQIGALLPEFQKLLDSETNIKNEQLKLLYDYTKSVSDLYVKDWQNRINIVKEGNEAINDIANQNYDELINNAIRWQGTYGNALRDLYEDKDYYTETYNEQKGQLERLQQMYLDMAKDEKLTFEEKENAKREAAKVTGELVQLEYDKEVNMLKVQKGLWKEWANSIKDAASSVGDILGTLSDYYTGLMELEQAKIDKQLEDKEITEEQAKALYAQQKENFDKAKNMQLAMTWINGFSAAIGAYQSMASIPYVGPILGAAAAAAALATTALQAEKIKQTSMDNPYGDSGSGSSSTGFQLPDVMEYEPQIGRNLTGQNDTDTLNNGGQGGNMRVYVVESDISNALDKSNKRKTEVTF